MDATSPDGRATTRQECKPSKNLSHLPCWSHLPDGCKPNARYMNDIQLNAVKPGMRATVVDWLIDLSVGNHFRDDTLHLAVVLFDMYLSRHVVPTQRLQLVGAVSLLVASKYDEVYSLTVDKCVHFCANMYPRNEVVMFERQFLNGIDYRLRVPTISLLIRELQGGDLTTLHLSAYFAEVVTMNIEYLSFPLMDIGCACVLLARWCTYPHVPITELWDENIYSLSQVPLEILRSALCFIAECVRKEYGVKGTSSAIPQHKLEAIRRKYSTTARGSIALLPLPNVLDQLEL